MCLKKLFRLKFFSEKAFYELSHETCLPSVPGSASSDRMFKIGVLPEMRERWFPNYGISSADGIFHDVIPSADGIFHDVIPSAHGIFYGFNPEFSMLSCSNALLVCIAGQPCRS